MENKLEQLLNSLIEKGWKPFKIKSDNMWLYCLSDNKIVISYYVLNTEGEWDHEDKRCSYRELVSKESLLWQFCEENKMLIGFSPRTRTKNAHETYGSILGDIEYWGSDYEYRLIESSLKDESELEDFLLNSIKLDEI